MENKNYTPKDKAFLAVLWMKYRGNTNISYTPAEIRLQLNKIAFDSKYDTKRGELKGTFIRDEKQGLKKLEKFIQEKNKGRFFSGYIVSRTGEKIYSFGQDGIFIIRGIPNFHWVIGKGGLQHYILKDVTAIENFGIKKSQPIGNTAFDKAQYENKMRLEDQLQQHKAEPIKISAELEALQEKERTNEPLSLGERAKLKWGM